MAFKCLSLSLTDNLYLRDSSVFLYDTSWCNRERRSEVNRLVYGGLDLDLTSFDATLMYELKGFRVGHIVTLTGVGLWSV